MGVGLGVGVGVGEGLGVGPGVGVGVVLRLGVEVEPADVGFGEGVGVGARLPGFGVGLVVSPVCPFVEPPVALPFTLPVLLSLPPTATESRLVELSAAGLVKKKPIIIIMAKPRKQSNIEPATNVFKLSLNGSFMT